MPSHIQAQGLPDRYHEASELKLRVEELEIAVRAALSFVQGRHTDQTDGHAQMVIAALRGALRNSERD